VYTPVPSGATGGATTSSTAANFTFIPPLIHQRRYEFSFDNIVKWWRKDFLAQYLIQSLTQKALGDGFHLADPDDEDEEPVREWDAWERALRKKCHIKDIINVVQGTRAFGISMLNYTQAGRFQVLYGNKLTQVKQDDFGEITDVSVRMGKKLDVSNLRIYRNEFPDDPMGYSYLEPIWDNFVFIKWITFSMCEAAAAEGAKFLTIGVNQPKKGTITRLSVALPGISARKAFVHDVAIVPPEAIRVHDTRLSALFTDYLLACYRQIALYTCIPESHLYGVQQGKVVGAETDIGSEYEALSLIQRDVEPFLMDVLRSPPFRFEVDELKFVWHKKARLTATQEAELEELKARTNEIKLAWMLPDEIREAYKLRPLPADSGKFIKSLLMKVSGEGLQEDEVGSTIV